ncbi:MAG: hypothetical protein ACK5C5_10410, partial [Bacteroidota bacterium]
MKKNLIVFVLSFFTIQIAAAQQCIVSAYQNSSCYSPGCDYSAYVYVENYSPPYSVNITGPFSGTTTTNTYGPFTNPTNSINLNNLCVGSYQIDVLDSLGGVCTNTTLNISAPPPVTFNYNIDFPASCDTCHDAIVSTSVWGGNWPSGSLLGPSGATNQSSIPIPTGQSVVVAPGNYNGYILDGNCWQNVSMYVPAWAVAGKVYVDLNFNGVRDAGEPGLPNQQVALNPAGTTITTSSFGTFGFFPTPGTYDVTYVPTPGWTLTSSPSNYTITYGTNSIYHLDFGVVPDTSLGYCAVTATQTGFCPLAGQGCYSFNNQGLAVSLQSTGVNGPYMAELSYSGTPGPPWTYYGTYGPISSGIYVIDSLPFPGFYQVTLIDSFGNQCSQIVFEIFGQNGYINFNYQLVNASCATCNDGAVQILTNCNDVLTSTPFGTQLFGTTAQNLPSGYYGVQGYIWPGSFGCSYNSGFFIGVGRITGNIYLDANSNGVRDSGEINLSNQQAQINPTGTILYSYYNFGYGSSVVPGTYDISYVAIPDWQLTSSPSTYTVTYSAASISNLDFGVVPTSNLADGDVSLTNDFPRCFNTVPYHLNFYNRGGIPLSGTVSFSFDTLLACTGSSVPPSAQNGNSLQYTFSNLNPGETFSVDVYLLMPGGNNTVNAILTVNAVDPLGNQVSVSSGSSQLVRCAFDPNDKAVYPSGIGPLNYVAMDQRLDYIIRFQNTGNDTAFKVIIVDTLDAALDLATFTLLGSSHPVQTEINSNGEISFKFFDILLPDSNVNEPASHGYVLYSIQGLTTNPDPTTVQNTAYIYFDQNPPIQTNT